MARGGAPLPVREYTSADIAEMRRHAREVKARLYAGRFPDPPQPRRQPDLSAFAAELSRCELVKPGSAKPVERPIDTFVERALATYSLIDLSIAPQCREKGATHRGDECVAIIAGVSEFSLHALRSERRFTSLAKARQIGFWLLISYAKKSLPEAGRYFGDRDHTTALHGVRQVRGAIRDLGLTVSADPMEMAERLWNADWPAKVKAREPVAASRERARQ